MAQPTTCKFCRSTNVPEDLRCVQMCDLCCAQGIDILMHGIGRIRSALLRRHLRRWRQNLDEVTGVATMRAALL